MSEDTSQHESTHSHHQYYHEPRDEQEYHRLVREALEVNDYSDLESARDWLEDRIRETDNPAVHFSIAMHHGLMHDLLCARANIRSELRRDASETAAAKAQKVYEGQQKGLHRFDLKMQAKCAFDFPLPLTGKPLGDATVADLDEVIEYRAKRSVFEQNEMIWTQRVRNALKQSGQPTVRTGLTLNELRAMMTEV